MQHIIATLATAACFAAAASADQTLKTLKLNDQESLSYTLTTPEKFDPKAPVPIVIAFPGGPQTGRMETSLRAMLADECTKRGWVLITPYSQTNKRFLDHIDEMVKPLITELDSTLVPEGNKYHLCGISNGGITALNFAWRYPHRTASVTAFPGMISDKDFKETTDAPKLAGIPIRIWCGGDDNLTWQNNIHALEDLAKKHNLDVKATFVPIEGHIIRSLTGAMVADEIEKARNPAGTLKPEQKAVLATLDALHAAASKADAAAYFALFADHAVFIGTDAGERWTLEEFKAYAAPHFSKGKGWTYKPREDTRHVDLSADGKTAWFDEILDNEKYGTTRGTGVLTLIDGSWRLNQYHLTIPVPNPLAERVAKMIKNEEGKKKN